MRILTQNSLIREEENWTDYLATAISDPKVLIEKLGLPLDLFEQDFAARQLFALRVPLPFVARMEKGNPNDPLFLQAMTSQLEFVQAEGFSPDPLEEQQTAAPNILHKYHNRLLFMVKNSCAINCRYCFRRHFPYAENKGSKENWQQALAYISQHSEIEEVIFSGGDPLMAKDHELEWLIKRLENIPHLQRLRIHSRLPVVIPQRITEKLCALLAQSRFQVVLVTHINHPNEIDDALATAMAKLKAAGVTLLNQAVLLKNINDNALTLKALSEKLFAIGILPYYLHLFDKVEGASHFYLDDESAVKIYKELQSITSGYLVPKLAREIAHEPNKTLYSS
ncbi:EF-P beta-lysylation protein EpmB [Avibacterium paragallinarum]|uniref:EF-P beta-lysylation protein EpmB n=1 Tax=Avibacterium paragallinarum TaxID=728 RepID=UPI00021ACFA2|nr:EF-P beta-lysylation protein EpmB [Avibacterium paragallinarum]QIR11894.1 EF-P beta-lysylation protein EpmB [Avibacterium paragallinarum]QJE09779.1 EF-P beta-lysylation protein EpmB [Avibacterium paragallinarum]QJE11975.1 EF-P beta-lysylation protein EpmB [Avibacterium paragallinarum]QJE14175.1 EF-P beta-lysylation protein EpmB [Avibacterium paragallinarum]QJE16376.1 EF-P beta-lysylation protein EpmB [Avibacterium paragallinarum]